MNNEVNEVINNICKKFGTTIEKIVPEFSKYMVVTSLKDFIIGMALLAFTAIIFKSLFKWLKSHIDDYKATYSRNDWTDESFALTFFIGCIPLIFTAGVGLVFTINGLKFLDWLISPQGAFFSYVLSKLNI